MTGRKWREPSHSADDPAALAESWARKHGPEPWQWPWETKLAIEAFKAGYAAARAGRDGHCRECAAGQPCEDHPDVGELIGYEAGGKMYHPADVTIVRRDPDVKTAPAS